MYGIFYDALERFVDMKKKQKTNKQEIISLVLLEIQVARESSTYSKMPKDGLNSRMMNDLLFAPKMTILIFFLTQRGIIPSSKQMTMRTFAKLNSSKYPCKPKTKK